MSDFNKIFWHLEYFAWTPCKYVGKVRIDNILCNVSFKETYLESSYKNQQSNSYEWVTGWFLPIFVGPPCIFLKITFPTYNLFSKISLIFQLSSIAKKKENFLRQITLKVYLRSKASAFSFNEQVEYIDWVGFLSGFAPLYHRRTLWVRLLDIWCLVCTSSFWQSGGPSTFSVVISMPSSIKKENGKVWDGTKVPSALEVIPCVLRGKNYFLSIFVIIERAKRARPLSTLVEITLFHKKLQRRY